MPDRSERDAPTDPVAVTPLKAEGHIFSADRPIESVDEDLLGRGPFSESLAKAIDGWREKDSLILGLYGPWGSGKSSIKNMVREVLTQSRTGPLRIVEYNPWQWAGQEQLAEGFFNEVGAALGRSDKTKKGRKRAALWQAYSAYLHVGAIVAGGAKRLIAAIFAVLGAIGLASWNEEWRLRHRRSHRPCSRRRPRMGGEARWRDL